jgi:cytidylate kinase
VIRSGIVAIDGPAASGKSSTARAVAESLGFAHLDSGALYRGVTYVTLGEAARAGTSNNPVAVVPVETMLRATEDRGFMLQPDGAGFAAYIDGGPADTLIRTREVTAHVSAVSAIPAVREWVNAHLRGLARAGIGVVVDGRDIGTVVFPEADLKVFLTASPEARALRRLRQVGAAHDPVAVAREAAVLAARDAADSARVVAPLRRPHDAVEIDTSTLSFDAQVDRIVSLARDALSR